MAPAEPDRKERELAQVILSKTLRVRPGDSVSIEAWSNSLGIAKSCALQAVELGARPMIQFHDDASYWSLVARGYAQTLGALGDHEHAALAKTDAYVFFEGPADQGRYNALDDKTREHLVSWEMKWWHQAERAGLRIAWVLLGRAVPGSARYFGVNLATWRAELFRASMVDPTVLRRAGSRTARAFQTGKVVHITHPNGTDLTLRLRRRPVSIHDGAIDGRDLAMGRFMEVVPSGYVPAALSERFAEGEIISNVPGRTMAGGDALTGGHWTFHNGRLVNFSHAQGQNEVANSYAAAPPDGRDRVGVVSVGLNPEIRMAPYVTDQRSGRLMLLVGGNRHYGGSNPNPFQMYLLLDGATLTVDGRTLIRDGRLA